MLSYYIRALSLAGLFWVILFWGGWTLDTPLGWLAPGPRTGPAVLLHWYFHSAGRGQSPAQKPGPGTQTKKPASPGNQVFKFPGADPRFRGPEEARYWPNVWSNEKDIVFFRDFGAGLAGRIARAPGYLYATAHRARGVIRYQKYDPDMKLEFYSPGGEKYWESPDRVYPVQNFDGSRNLYLTSNNYKIHLANRDGRILNSVEGPFFVGAGQAGTSLEPGANAMVSGAHPAVGPRKNSPAGKTWTVLAYLGGYLALLDPGGRPLAYLDQPGRYYKSVALSPGAKYVLLHGLEKKSGETETGEASQRNDFFELFALVRPEKPGDEEKAGQGSAKASAGKAGGKKTPAGKLESRWYLPVEGPVPHRLFLAVSQSGHGMIQLPGQTLLLDDDGAPLARYYFDGKVYHQEAGEEVAGRRLQVRAGYVLPVEGGRVYRPVSVAGPWFLFQLGAEYWLVDEDSHLLARLPGPRSGPPGDIALSPDGRWISIRESDRFRIYRFLDFH